MHMFLTNSTLSYSDGHTLCQGSSSTSVRAISSSAEQSEIYEGVEYLPDAAMTGGSIGANPTPS